MLHLEILDTSRKALVPDLAFAGDFDFYLAGGTALALQLGHRDSDDFDFFIDSDFDATTLYKTVEAKLAKYHLRVVQLAENTLELSTESNIKISFLSFKHSLIADSLQVEGLKLASVLDIAVMKFSAITQRAELKDYVDIYWILKSTQYSLNDLLLALERKLPNLDPMAVLRALTYTNDLGGAKVRFKPEFAVELDEITQFLIAASRKALI